MKIYVASAKDLILMQTHINFLTERHIFSIDKGNILKGDLNMIARSETAHSLIDSFRNSNISCAIFLPASEMAFTAYA